MRIDEIIQQDAMFKKYANKYVKPLTKYYNPASLPDRYFKTFIKQADIHEIALYYMGYCNKRCHEMPSILAYLYRHHDFEIPVIEGILTENYWLNWYCEHYVDITVQHNCFF